MDLANLQISITTKGVDNALNQLDKLSSTANTAETAISKLASALNASGGISYNILEVGYAAKSASTEVATLVRQLNSIGVNKLSDLVRVSREVAKSQDVLNKSKGVAAKAWGEEEKAINGVIVAEGRVKVAQNETLSSAERLNQAKAHSATSNQRLATELQRTANEATRGELLNNRMAKSHSNLSKEVNLNSSNYELFTQRLGQHTTGWLRHMTTVAGGIILYQGIRSALGAVISLFQDSIKTIQVFEDFQIQGSAMLTSNAKNQTNLAETYKQSSKYMEALVPWLLQVDIKSRMSFEGLQLMTKEFFKQGMAININSEAVKKNYTALSNVVSLFSNQGGGDLAKQITTETKALLEGSTRAGSEVARMFDSMMGGKLRENIMKWKKEGPDAVLEHLAEYSKGFIAASKDIEGSWGAVTSTLRSTVMLLENAAFKPLLKDMGVLLRQFNDYLISNKVAIQSSIMNGWNILKSVTKLVWDNLDKIILALELIIAAKITQGITTLILGFQVLEAVIIRVGLASTMALVGATGGLALFAIGAVAAINLVINRWDVLINAVKLFRLVLEGRVSVADWMNAGPDQAKHIVDSANINDQQAALRAARTNTDWTQGPPKVRTNVGEWTDESNQSKRTGVRFGTSAITAPEQNKPTTTDKKTGAERLAESMAETRKSLLAKWNDEANDAIKNLRIIDKDTRTVTETIDKYNRTLTDRKKPLAGLNPEEEKQLQRSLAMVIVRKRIATESEAIYSASTEPLKKYQAAIIAVRELEAKYPEKADFYSRSLRKIQHDYEDSLDPLASMTKALEDERDTLGLTADESERLVYYQSILKALNIDNTSELNANDAARIKVIMGMRDQNKYMKDNIPMWTQMKTAMKSWGNDFGNTLNEVLYGAQLTFKSIAQSFLKMITQIIIQTQIVKPFLSFLGLADGGVISNGKVVTNANGNAFMGGSIVPFATGGIVTKPTFFPMANGAGLMGEAGPEAVMPLTRINGSLGVKAQTSVPNIQVNIVNNTGTPIKNDTKTSFDGKAYIITTVLQAVSTNDGGMKDGLKSMLRS